MLSSLHWELTVWCQQHDEHTLEPASARAYELPSYCSQESAAIVRLLMSLPHPDKRVKRAVHHAMKWFDTYKLTGYRVERIREGFLPDGQEPEGLLSNDLSQMKAITSVTYQALYCAMKRETGRIGDEDDREEGPEEGIDETETVDFSDFDLQKAVKEASTSKDPVLYIQGIYPTGKKGYFAVPLQND